MSLAAPEILTKYGYTYPIDWWSLSVCAFELLFECRPFWCVVRPCSSIQCVKFHQMMNLCVHEMCQMVFACCCLVCVHEQLRQLADCPKVFSWQEPTIGCISTPGRQVHSMPCNVSLYSGGLIEHNRHTLLTKACISHVAHIVIS